VSLFGDTFLVSFFWGHCFDETLLVTLLW